ncbi:MAG: hypothetical protein NTX98_01685 [Candidatus Doudnabacteria bacterium]|nr:hypothetical protein [Candidatus Doudnabacteria bacterium]
MNQELLKNLKGSSFLSPAHGKGGAGTTPLSFLLSVPPPFEKTLSGFQQAGKKEGVLWEVIFARLSKKRSPAVLLGQSRGQQKSFLFLLEEKIGRAQIKKCEENFFAGQRAKRAAAGRSESAGISFKMSSDFFQQTPPKFIYGVICLARGFAPRFGRHFRKVIPRGFEINRQFSRRKAAVHPATAGYCDKAAMSRWFSFAFGEKQNEILQIVGVKRCLFIKLKTSKNYD